MVKIRLARHGSNKKPFYWMVAASSASPRNGRFLEKLGTYNPKVEKENPNWCTVKDERVTYWLGVGAQPTERVAWLLHKKMNRPLPPITPKPIRSAPKQKA